MVLRYTRYLVNLVIERLFNKLYVHLVFLEKNFLPGKSQHALAQMNKQNSAKTNLCVIQVNFDKKHQTLKNHRDTDKSS